MKQAEKSVSARRRSRPSERGAALLLFMILAVTAVLSYLISGLTPEDVEQRRNQQTHEALAQAREALIGYALKYRESQPDRMYGYLPLPDLGSSRNNNAGCGLANEGCDANTFTGIAFDVNGIGPSVVGRFPWRTLGTEPLRDGSGECLWLIVSSLHSRIHASASPYLPPMNWDTPGQLDIVVANGSAALVSALASAHERPVAVIFSPGPPLPGQDRSPSATDNVDICGGNYDARNYLDPVNAASLGGVTNYLAGANGASGATGDSDPSNDPDAPKGLVPRGRLFASGGNFLPNACEGNCNLLANDAGLALTGDALFAAIRKNANFRTDINSMLDRMSNCLRDKFIAGGFAPGAIAGFTPPADKSAGRIPYDACYDSSKVPLGYYDHYREMLFVAKPNAGNFTVNGDTNCSGVLLFANQRGSGQQRITSLPSPGDKGTLSNYLEGNNLTNFTTVTATPPAVFGSIGGPTLLDRSPPQAVEQDIARCVPVGASFTTVTSPTLGVNQLVAYDAATRILTLGRQDITTGWGYNANALFGCAWFSESRTLGNGLRSYFKFQFKKVGTSVGGNGFVFAIADAMKNDLTRCGAGGSHLGYSGNNGVTLPLPILPIEFPKIGIEFDQRRDTGFSESADLNVSNPGRNDPDGTATVGYNSHVAIVYWGHDAAGADGVTRPDDDDNVHGFPTVGSLPGDTTPPPRNPNTAPGIIFENMRGYDYGSSSYDSNFDSKIFYIRVEVTPTRAVSADPELSSTSIRIEAWMEWDPSLTDRLSAIQNTTRPMSLLYPAYATTPTLSDTAILYDVPNGDCSTPGCPACKSATNTCFWPALNRIQLGFTGSQRTSDQQVKIQDFFTTWLP
jgi:hypothetical protein